MAINIWIISTKPFDPYPFILLNLILSCLAAIQAPIIMMSQNRQGTIDRLSAQHDYDINIKSELEIELLHQKIDMLRETEIAELITITDRIAAAVDHWDEISAGAITELRSAIDLMRGGKACATVSALLAAHSELNTPPG